MDEYLCLPWEEVRRLCLPDHLLCTYQLLLSLAQQAGGQRTPPLPRHELARLRGVSLRTLGRHLQALRQRGLVRRDPLHSGPGVVWVLSGPKPQAPEEGQQSPPSLRLSPSLERKESPSGSEEEERALTRELLERVGVYTHLAEELARLPWVRPFLVEAWVQALRRNPRVRHLGAVLATLLRNPARCLPPPKMPPEEPSEGGLEEGSAAEGQSPLVEELLPWGEVLARLEERLGREQVETWLRGSYPLSWEDGVLVIAVRTPRAADWLEYRRREDVLAAVEEVTGQRPRISFAVA